MVEKAQGILRSELACETGPALNGAAGPDRQQITRSNWISHTTAKSRPSGSGAECGRPQIHRDRLEPISAPPRVSTVGDVH
ncbi:hypothetical protein B0293_32115 [Amycolatopsis azurea DSM 43854]|uniref:Uncharacterized protein n=1 Tax=Amycolatopsis azurea DSM 43854 TaxID=1238180 RepID=A0ABX3J552_9PSEU|nr:hypothetical protein B0293_32115 [Amycolatopsis azurea DSM 43854]